MTKQEYNDYIEALQKHGYKFVGSDKSRCYRKVIKYRKDEDGDYWVVCQLVFNIYKVQYHCSGDEYYSIVPVVVVTRNDDERLDFTIGSPERSVEECEHLAKEFLRWVDVNVDIK